MSRKVKILMLADWRGWRNDTIQMATAENAKMLIKKGLARDLTPEPKPKIETTKAAPPETPERPRK